MEQEFDVLKAVVRRRNRACPHLTVHLYGEPVIPLPDEKLSESTAEDEPLRFLALRQGGRPSRTIRVNDLGGRGATRYHGVERVFSLPVSPFKTHGDPLDGLSIWK